MHKAFKHLNERFNESLFSIGTAIFGVYVLFHINYLDSPKITPFPPPPDIREVLGFTDDLWFAILLLTIGILTLLSVMLNWHRLMNLGMVTISVIYAFCFAEFFARGVISNHFNVTWIAYLMLFFLMERTIYKGGGRK